MSRIKIFKTILIALIIIASIVCFNRHIKRSSLRKFADFHCYYVTGQRALAHENIYVSHDNQIAEFRYSPLFATMMSGFALVSEQNANIIWWLLNYSLLFISFILLKKLILPQKLSFGKTVLLYFLTYIATVRLIFNNLDSGQANILTLASIIIGLYFISRKKEVLGGAILALSIMIKYTPVIFILYFLVRKKFKLSLAIISFMILYFLLPALFIGFKTNLEYLKNMLGFLTNSTILDPGTMYDYENQSLMSMLLRFFTTYKPGTNIPNFFQSMANLSDITVDFLNFFINLLILGAILLPARAGRNKTNPFYQNIDYTLIFISIILLNLNAWMHNYIFLMMSFFLAISYLIVKGIKDKTTFILIILAHILNLITGKELCGKTFSYLAHFYSPHTISALIMIFVLLRLKFSKKEIILE